MTGNKDELLKGLSSLQYEVTQRNGTEKPYTSEFLHNGEEGIYVDVVSHEPLFSTQDQYDAGCGWPSFAKPIADSMLVKKVDSNYGMIRTEVRSREADSHLGHVFPDGLPDKGGLRYCINGAALSFIPKSKLVEEGYEEYLKLFE